MNYNEITANGIAEVKYVPVFLTVVGSKTYEDYVAPDKPKSKTLALMAHFEPEHRREVSFPHARPKT